MRILKASIVLIVGLASSAAWAVDACDDGSDQATMNECADSAFQAADAELNSQYSQIAKRLADNSAGDAKKLLVASQRAWISFRDAECAFQSSGVEGGSIYPMIQSNCMAALTNSRIADFKTYLGCDEGDMSCPVPPAQ